MRSLCVSESAACLLVSRVVKSLPRLTSVLTGTGTAGVALLLATLAGPALGQDAPVSPPPLPTTEEMVTNLRLSPHEEVEGLDIGEHGNEAYHGFQMIRTE